MLTSIAINKGGLGRFGNNCFTIAGVIGTAIKSGQQYAFPEWIVKDNEIFGQKADNINNELLKPLPALANWDGFNSTGYFWGYKDLYLPNGNWIIDAHCQSEKFFKHCLPLIRETFTFKDEPEQNDYVAIHYRAGDYIDDPNAQHPRCSVQYYTEAIRLMQQDGKKNFIVFSDGDFPYFKDEINHGLWNNFKINKSISYIEDFKLMKRCKSFICANSSFSLMAAILGDHPEKKIVCPRNWFGSQMPPEFNTDDIYPEGAIII